MFSPISAPICGAAIARLFNKMNTIVEWKNIFMPDTGTNYKNFVNLIDVFNTGIHGNTIALSGPA